MEGGCSESSKKWIKKIENGYYCKVCSCTIPYSKCVLTSHLSGTRHCSAMKRKEEEKKLAESLKCAGSDKYFGIVEQDKGYYCQMCDCTCTSTSNVETHITGSKHLYEVRIRSHHGTTSRSPKAGESPAPPGHKSSHLETLLKKEDLVVGLDFVAEYQAEGGCWYYSCALCKFKCKESDIRAHVTGLSHQMAIMKDYKREEYERLRNLSSRKLAQRVESWAAGFNRRYGRGHPTSKPLPRLMDKQPSPKSPAGDSDVEICTPPPKNVPSPEVVDLDSDEDSPVASPSTAAEDGWQKLIQQLRCSSQAEADSLLDLATFLLSKCVEYDLRDLLPEDKVQQVLAANRAWNLQYCNNFFKNFAMKTSKTLP